MKAMVLRNIGDFKLETVDKPVLNAGEVLVSVKAAGICGSDIPRVYRTGTYAYPLIPGHECSGIVIETGSGVESGWLGCRVGIFPLIPCRNCLPCKRKQYEMCRSYSYLGSRRNGGFAEYAAVPAENLIHIPDNVSFEEAAMLEPMAVAVHAIRRIHPKDSDTVVVCGLGTIGLLVLMFLQEAGIKNVLAVGNKDSQKQAAIRLGLLESSYCDSRNADVSNWIFERTDGNGADLFFECVGKNETLIQAVNNTAPGGQICLVGNPSADMNLERSVYWKILRNQLMMTGTWNSSFQHSSGDDWHYALEKLKMKKIFPAKLISHRFSLEELWRGFHIMRDKTEDYGKIMGTFEV